MALESGTRLGPYRLEGALGAGGMGEVYRARDVRLDRTVAIKILPASIASDQESRQRFEREAKAIAALSHPHICTLYDVGEEAGPDTSTAERVQFLVMEYLEGDTLAGVLRAKRLPLDQVIRIGIQCADALDRAHRTGIVHRDLKPGNIMLTARGAVLLDFGLARTLRPGPVSGLNVDATVTTPLTSQGTILGTLHYMAPEQVEGKDADTRSDIFSLGTILYEMAMGQEGVRGQQRCRRDGRDSGTRTGADVGARATGAADPRAHRGALPGQGSERAVAERRRRHARTDLAGTNGRPHD